MPTSERLFLCKVCFSALILVGVGFLAMGLLVRPNRPHFQLDAVLTPEELANDEERQATPTLLKKLARGNNNWIFWTVSGALVTAVSTFGQWMLFGIEKSNGSGADVNRDIAD
jgi:hypothetical protein